MNRRTTKNLCLTGLFALLTLTTLACNNPAQSNQATSNQLVSKILERRKRHIARYYKVDQLLELLESGSYWFELHNPSDKTVRIEAPDLWYNSSRLKQDLALDASDDPQTKLLKIYKLVQSRHSHSEPLYNTDLMHYPIRFLSTFGTGFCDDVAHVSSSIALQHGYRARIWRLNGHTLPEFYYSSAWHVLDPFKPGLGATYKPNGAIADLKHLVQLAKEDKLAHYNQEVRTTDDNQVTEIRAEQLRSGPNPYLEMLPYERRYFFKRAYVLSTDGHRIRKKPELNRAENFLPQYSSIANYVRVIPLDKQAHSNGKTFEIRDYFPIVAAFIRTSNPSTTAWKSLNSMLVTAESSAWLDQVWTAGEHWSKPGLGSLLSFSHALQHLDHNPSFALILTGPNNSPTTLNRVELITVHYYSRLNTYESPLSLRELEAVGFVITKPSESETPLQPT